MTAPEGANLFRVQNKDTKHEHKVNTEKHTCTCDYFIEHKQPCRHMCVVFHETRRLGDSPEKPMATFQQFWPSWALSTSLSVYCKKSLNALQFFLVRLQVVMQTEFFPRHRENLRVALEKNELQESLKRGADKRVE